MNKLVIASVLAWTSLADAAPTVKDVTALLTAQGEQDTSALKLTFDSLGVHLAPKDWFDADADLRDFTKVLDPVIAASTDGTAAWAALHVRSFAACQGLYSTYDKCNEPKTPSFNVLLLLDKTAKGWAPVALHSATPLTDKQIAQLQTDGIKPAPLTKHVESAAEPAVAAFTEAIADPKLLAASVSDRKDVVLFGSGPGERVVGGKPVAAKLAAWKLAMTVQGGVIAGTTASKTVAWVAANVDARPFGKPDAKPAAYRVLAIYERKVTAWQLVGIEFSYVADSWNR